MPRLSGSSISPSPRNAQTCCSRRVLEPAHVEVAVGPCLVDGRCRAKAHRDGGELPHVGHEARVRVGRQPAAGARLLLPERVEVVLGEATLDESARVHAWRRVALEVDLVAAARVVLALEEVVEAHLVQRRDGRVGRDVSADALARGLGARDHDGGVPADPAPVAALDLLVAGEFGLVVHVNRVDVRACSG